MIVSKRLSDDLRRAVDAMPEALTRDDLERNCWLRRLVEAANELSGKVSRRDLEALKSGWLEEGVADQARGMAYE